MCVTGVRVCTQGALEGHRDLSLGRERGSPAAVGRDGGGLPRLKNRGFTALATKLELRCFLLPLARPLANFLAALSGRIAKLAAVWIKIFRFEPKKLYRGGK